MKLMMFPMILKTDLDQYHLVSMFTRTTNPEGRITQHRQFRKRAIESTLGKELESKLHRSAPEELRDRHVCLR